MLAREVNELLKIDFLARLPPEVSFQILRLLDSESLCKAAQVSRRWKTLADDDGKSNRLVVLAHMLTLALEVWFHICQQHVDRRCTKCGWGLPLLERQRLRDWKRRQAVVEQRQAKIVDAVPVVGTKRALVLAEDSRKRNCTSRVGTTPPEERRKQSRPWKSVYRERFRVCC